MLKVLLIAIAVAAAISGTALADAFTPALLANIQAEGKSQFMKTTGSPMGKSKPASVG